MRNFEILDLLKGGLVSLVKNSARLNKKWRGSNDLKQQLTDNKRWWWMTTTTTTTTTREISNTIIFIDGVQSATLICSAESSLNTDAEIKKRSISFIPWLQSKPPLSGLSQKHWPLQQFPVTQLHSGMIISATILFSYNAVALVYSVIQLNLGMTSASNVTKVPSRKMVAVNCTTRVDAICKLHSFVISAI